MTQPLITIIKRFTIGNRESWRVKHSEGTHDFDNEAAARHCAALLEKYYEGKQRV